MKIDYHIHGKHSSDSQTDYESIVVKAIRRKYKEIAFADHFDLIMSEIRRYGVPAYNDILKSINPLKEKYSQLSILIGVEIGDYHRCHQLIDELFAENPPDIKIASVHVLRDDTNISIPIKGQLKPELIRDYYEQNLAMVEFGNFDILGHLGVYKRYFLNQPDETEFLPIIKKIFTLLIEKEIALEVNLSGIGKPVRDLIPCISHLKIYKEMGGGLITIGSDSHTVEEFDNLFDQGVKRLKDIGISSYVRKSGAGWEPLSLV